MKKTKQRAISFSGKIMLPSQIDYPYKNLTIKCWVAKDGDGEISIFYENKPYKSLACSEDGYWLNINDLFDEITENQLPKGCNPQWTDEEPIEIYLKIEKKGKLL